MNSPDTHNTPASLSHKEKVAARNLDIVSALAFITAAGFGIVNTINNIRHAFYTSFVNGWGRLETPFSEITKSFGQRQKDNFEQYKSGAIDGAAYKKNILSIAKENQAAVNEKLLKDFDIPTTGVRGWTEGTVKRFKQIGRTSRLNAGIGFATTASIAVGAVSLLRHSKDTLDRIEAKFDSGEEERAR